MGLDVGPKTISSFEEAVAPCKTIVRGDVEWSGVGVSVPYRRRRVGFAERGTIVERTGLVW